MVPTLGTPCRARRRGVDLAAVAVFLLVAVAAREASAQQRPDELRLSYLWDGGALPFVWAAAGGALLLSTTVDAPEPPRWFSADEGGASFELDRELPGYVVTAGAVLLAAPIVTDRDPTRWFHLKGMVEGLAVTSLLTVAGKVTFGRHRPDYDAEHRVVGDTWSFPSGHASQALAAVTYAGLYLRLHGFDRWRPHGELRWWEGAAYGGLAAIAIAVPTERVYHHRHHVSDVITGSVLGATTAAAFFAWQEHRARQATTRAGATETTLLVAPMLSPPGLQVGWRLR